MTIRGRRWSSTEHTRRGVLAAAGDVFRQRGYTATGMAEIAHAAEVSIGSLYHHFAGKYELFAAVWREYDSANRRTTAAAVAEARHAGTTDETALFAVGLRAYLLASWADPGLARLFADGDTPAGFARTQRRSDELWAHENLAPLGVGDRPADRMRVALLAGFLEQARRQVVTAETPREADELLDAGLALMRQMRGLIGNEVANGVDGPPPAVAAPVALVS